MGNLIECACAGGSEVVFQDLEKEDIRPSIDVDQDIVLKLDL